MSATQRAMLIGHPLGHSLSPAFQNAAFRAAGINATYGLADVPPEDLAAAVAALRASDILGANVTVPYKRTVIPLLDALSDDARALGAVNTIVSQGGQLIGLNTDVPGFIADLRAHGIDVRGQTVALLGAGGAARAVAAGLVGEGVARLYILNRTRRHADLIAARYSDTVRALDAGDPSAREVIAAGSLLINATSVGLHGDELPIAADVLTFLPHGAAVYDLIYRPTALLREAARRGNRTIDGLGMLIHQGALAWEAWTNQPAPREVMWAAARQARGD